ncbi:MAG: hypothetical protein C5B51_32665 [Terriglobia bacterium]|nr:MAG: hypothetical protein C5B51_32665 [Terriglobia bacterium]
MPNIKITDQLGANIDVELAPSSSLLKYIRELPGIVLTGSDIMQLQILTLNDPAVRALSPSLSFTQPVSLGADGPELTVGATGGASFRVISRTPENSALFPDDEYGENIEIAAGTCYVALGFRFSVNAGIESGSGSLTFGVNAGSGLEVTSYRPFGLGPAAATITEALRQSLGSFVIPAHPDDLAAIPVGTIVTITGNGSLQFSATANLLAVANPLATVALPAPVPALAITQSGSVTAGASWEISTEYQVRVEKTDARHVRLGWYRKRDSEFKVTASAKAGIAAGQAMPLFQAVISAISSDAKADFEELQRAGLSAGKAASIEAAVKAAVSRKLEVAVSAAWGSLQEREAAFLYEVDLDALTDNAKTSLQSALTGDLSGFAEDNLPPGITEVRSILSQVRSKRFSWNVNLLGIFNVASVSKLAMTGAVTFTPSTGELVIADHATASRIEIAAANFGPDEEKLRHVMAESFLITAAYRGSRALVSAPELSTSHLFFRLDNHTGRDQMRRNAAIAAALGLGAATLPAGISDFGRTTVLAQTRYDDSSTRALFLKADGTPRPLGDYETAGRRAVAALVPPDGADAFRLRPATDDQLWSQMKDKGPANFGQLLPATEAEGVRPDYLAIQWWAQSMRDTAQILASMSQGTPGDPEFDKRRQQLGSHLEDVAAKAHVLFGSPWGLVAMFLVSGKKDGTELHITGPRFVFAPEPARVAAG